MTRCQAGHKEVSCEISVLEETISVVYSVCLIVQMSLIET